MGRKSGSWSGDPQVKPPFGTYVLDRGHPLAQGLVFATLFDPLMPVDLVSGAAATERSDTADIVIPSPQGLAYGGDSSFRYSTTQTGLDTISSAAWSMFGIARQSIASTYRMFLMTCDPISTGDRPASLGIDNTGHVNNTIIAYVGNTLVYRSANVLGSSPQDRFHNVGITVKGSATTDIRMFHKGEYIGDSSVVGGSTYTAGANRRTQHFTLSYSSLANSGMYGVVAYGWNRTLSDAEMYRASMFPYALLTPKVYRRYFVGGASGAVLEGTAALALDASAALTTAIQMSGTAALALSVTGDLTTGNLFGSASANLVVDSSGTLTTAIQMSGTAALAIDASATLTAPGAPGGSGLARIIGG